MRLKGLSFWFFPCHVFYWYSWFFLPQYKILIHVSNVPKDRFRKKFRCSFDGVCPFFVREAHVRGLSPRLSLPVFRSKDKLWGLNDWIFLKSMKQAFTAPSCSLIVTWTTIAKIVGALLQMRAGLSVTTFGSSYQTTFSHFANLPARCAQSLFLREANHFQC